MDRCKANGQIAGVYWTPFTDWAKNPEREIKEIPGYKYKDVYLYANGKPQELDGAYAVDPTHPAIEAMMKRTSELFHRAGFEYVKMDFMTHGAMEADNGIIRKYKQVFRDITMECNCLTNILAICISIFLFLLFSCSLCSV